MWNSQQQLKHLLVETIQVLCKNSLPDESSFCIEATIGITLSTDHVMVISFKERIKSDGSHLSLMIADEQESPQSKNTSNTSANHSHVSLPRSSCNSSDNSREHLVSENPTVCEQTDIPQTYSNSYAVDGEVSMLNIGVIDGEVTASYMPEYGSSEISAGNHFHVPSVDQYAATQCPPGHDNDTKDDIVVLKVEDGIDHADAVCGMPQVDTEVAAQPIQPRLYAQKRKPRQHVSRARFVGNVEHSHLIQPTSVSFEAIDMQPQYVDGPHPHNAAFNAS